MAIKRSSEFLRLGIFFGHSRYNTKFNNEKIPSVAVCSTSNHKCLGLLCGDVGLTITKCQLTPIIYAMGRLIHIVTVLVYQQTRDVGPMLV